ncbi:MAG: hypothetical protein ACKOSQ_12445 [Planctomycetaceae bacterium]
MQAAWIVGGVSAAVAAAGLAALVRTRWLQSRTLEKCVGISIGIHALLAIVCVFLGGLAPASWGTRDEGRMTMQVVLSAEDDAPAVAEGGDPAVDPATDPAADPVVEPPVEAEPALTAAATAPESPPADLVPLLEPPPELAPETTTAATVTAAASASEPSAAADRDVAPARPLPAVYADRQGARRAAAAAARGGSQETERAVEAALGWLAAAQSADGRWSAAAHGAGRGRASGGQHGPETGARSDHGVTGLALLAFLGAGGTHRSGPHAATVDSGLRFLVGRQRADGSLAGDAEFFAALYCHGMATLALAECAALTGDATLAPPLDRAIRHTLTLQHPVTGGWRYAAGDRGDTSQLGWQVMALESAAQAGVGGLEPARDRARAFLAGVSSGAAGGRASCRPGERPRGARRAAAPAGRMFLGPPPGQPAGAAALAAMGRAPPDRTAYNSYTWYYATLASFHAGGPQWEEWNRRLQAALLPLQRRDAGPLVGSWDPDPVWGGHGGRVYSTALSALTLEVYYRYLPVHERAARMAAAP